MHNYQDIAEMIANKGFATVEAVYSNAEIDGLLQVLAQIDSDKATFRKTADLFAIRQFLKEVPSVVPLIFTPTLTTINWDEETEAICPVKKGGIMFMKPLLLHASNKTTNQAQRRVIHIEFSRIELPERLNWSERLQYTTSAE